MLVRLLTFLSFWLGCSMVATVPDPPVVPVAKVMGATDSKLSPA